MKQRAQIQIIKRFFLSRLFIISIATLLFFVIFGVARAYYQEYKIYEEIRTMEEEISGLRQKKIESMDLLAYVLSPSFVEEKARTELNMKKPDENVVIVAKEKNNIFAEKYEESRNTGQNIGNPLKWWYYFYNQNSDN